MLGVEEMSIYRHKWQQPTPIPTACKLSAWVRDGRGQLAHALLDIRCGVREGLRKPSYVTQNDAPRGSFRGSDGWGVRQKMGGHRKTVILVILPKI